MGIERRIYTAGTNKARLDPFSPEKPEDVAFVKDLMDKLHVRFKDWVRIRRGQRLKAPRRDAVRRRLHARRAGDWRVGLIDGSATVDELVSNWRRSCPPSPVSRLSGRGLSLRLPRLALDTVLDALEERAWQINIR